MSNTVFPDPLQPLTCIDVLGFARLRISWRSEGCWTRKGPNPSSRNILCLVICRENACSLVILTVVMVLQQWRWNELLQQRREIVNLQDWYLFIHSFFHPSNVVQDPAKVCSHTHVSELALGRGAWPISPADRNSLEWIQSCATGWKLFAVLHKRRLIPMLLLQRANQCACLPSLMQI